MILEITKNDVLLSVREKLELQRKFKKEHAALYASMELGKALEISINSATSMTRPPYVMSDSCRDILIYLDGKQ